MKTRFSKYLMVFLALAIANCSDVGGESGGSGGSGGTGGSILTGSEDDNYSGMYNFKGITAVPAAQRPLKEIFVQGMQSEDTSGTSLSMRIPSVLTMRADGAYKGRLIYTGDIRWGSTSDSAHNIDSAVRYSDDNGATWSAARYIQHFDDFQDINTTGNNANVSDSTYSASFIDPGVVEDEDGNLIVVTTTFPWGSGSVTHALGKNGLNHFVYDENGNAYLKLRAGYWTAAQVVGDTWAEEGDDRYITVSDKKVDVSTNYPLLVPVGGGKILNRPDVKNGETLTFADLEETTTSDMLKVGTAWNNTQPTTNFAGWRVDENWYLYDHNDDPVMVTQYKQGASGTGKTPQHYTNTGVTVHAHLFYYASPLQVVARSYLFMAKSADGGQSWSKPVNITHFFMDPNKDNADSGKTSPMLKANTFIGVSPGAGLRLENGEKAGRIYFALQPDLAENAGSCTGTPIYSDDGGATWEFGQNVVNTTSAGYSITRMSETQYVEGPDNLLYAWHRTVVNNNSAVAYSVSPDYGHSWETFLHNSDAGNKLVATSVMIGATTLRRTTYNGGEMFALSLPNATSRMSGKVFLGYYMDKGDKFGIAGHTSKTRWVPVLPGVDSTSGWSDPISLSDPTHKFGYSSPVEMANGNLFVGYEFHNDPLATGDYTKRTLDGSVIRLTLEKLDEEDEE